MKPIINYKEHCKVRIRNSDPSFDKHECCKLLICLLSKRKHKDSGIYTEYGLINGDIVDVAIDLGKELILYEVQKEIGPQWQDSIKQRDLDLNVNTIVIPLKELSDNLPTLIKEIEGRIA